MKKVIKLTLALVLMVSANSLFAQKFGRINMQEVITAMPEFKEVQTNLQTYAKELQDNMEIIVVEYNNKLQEFQKNLNTYTESVRSFKEKELMELSQRGEEFRQVMQDEYAKKENELMAPVYEKAKNAIDKVSSSNGYLAIFNVLAGALAYMDEAALTDITPEVKKELGITETPEAK